MAKFIPGVNVAPPGNDERCGITFTLARELPLGCLRNKLNEEICSFLVPIVLQRMELLLTVSKEMNYDSISNGQ